MTHRVHFKPEPGRPQSIPELVGHMLKDKSGAPRHINYVVYHHYGPEGEAPKRMIVLSTMEHGKLKGHNKVLNAGRLTFQKFARGEVRVTHLPISIGHPTASLTPDEEVHAINEFVNGQIRNAEGKGMAAVRKKTLSIDVAWSDGAHLLRRLAADRRTPIPGMGAPRRYMRTD